MDTTKQIDILTKQNDSIFNSLKNREIEFERISINDNLTNNEKLEILQKENNKLKEVVKLNKPPPQPKKEKIQVKKEESNNNDNEEEDIKEKIKSYDTITNMEDLKRSFFNDDYENFESLIKSNNFKFYNVTYKYDTDKDNCPDYSAMNLVKGFVRNFDNYRKYFMICFRCNQEDKNIQKYNYNSLWVVNTKEPIQNIIGSLYDYFNFDENVNLDKFLIDIRKINDFENNNCIAESFVH